MTSNRGAGFSSNPRSRLDGQKGALGAGGSILPKKQEPSAEEVRARAGPCGNCRPRVADRPGCQAGDHHHHHHTHAPAQVARAAEKRVHELLEASVELGQQGSTQAGARCDLSQGS